MLKKIVNIIIENLFHFMIVGSIYIVIFIIPICLSAYENGWIDKSYEKKYILTDGNKTVVFQGMTHIGLKSFYHEVGKEMTEYRNSGYQIMLEGIGHDGFKRLDKDHKDYTQSKIAFDNYKNFLTKTEDNDYKYTYQNIIFNKYIDYNDAYADLSRDALLKVVKENKSSQNILKTDDEIDSYLDSFGDHEEVFNILTEDEKIFIFMRNIGDSMYVKFLDNYVPKLLNYFNEENKLKDHIIITERDENIVNEILKSNSKNIYITYGSAHFNGVFNNLKNINSNWKIIDIQEKLIFDSTL